jgi:3-oxoacyl-[acyl-carrier protein] reductase
MDLGIAGRRALVLGGNRGMGFAIARALIAEGVKVTIAARDEAVCAEAAQALGGVAWVKVELADTDSFAAFAAQVGPLDILINNTGGPPYGGAAGRDAADWIESFQSMSLSVIKMTDQFLPDMKAAGWGRIVTIVSAGAVQPIPVLGISNTLRAGLIAWSKSLSGDVAKDGVTVNTLMPGRIATERVTLTDLATAKTEGIPVEQVAARSQSRIPMGRYGDPREIADTITFICSQSASYMTGSVIRVDGGIITHV